MTIDRIESVLGVFYDWSGIVRLLKKIDEQKYQKYMHLENPDSTSWYDLNHHEIVNEVISFGGVDFGVFRYPHDIEYEIGHDCYRVYLVFGFVVSSATSETAPYVRPVEEVLKNLEVLKMVIDDDDIPTFHTIPDDCNCCS